jgi:hypothetical protein
MKRSTKKEPIASEQSHAEWCKNKSELARILGVTRRTLDAWILLPEAPKQTGTAFDVTAWRDFASTRRPGKTSEGAELRLENLRLTVALNEAKLMKQAGDLIPVEWAKGLVADHAIKTRNIILAAPIAQADRDSLIEQIAAISSDDFIAGLRAQIGEERETE